MFEQFRAVPDSRSCPHVERNNPPHRLRSLMKEINHGKERKQLFKYNVFFSICNSHLFDFSIVIERRIVTETGNVCGLQNPARDG